MTRRTLLVQPVEIPAESGLRHYAIAQGTSGRPRPYTRVNFATCSLRERISVSGSRHACPASARHDYYAQRLHEYGG